MLCERCNKKKATVIYRENLAGRVRVLRLCGECTEVLEAAGELEELGTAMAPYGSVFVRNEDNGGALPFFLPVGGTGSGSSGRGGGGALKCPSCGSTLGEITSGGRVGCASCYRTFAEPLAVVIRALHGEASHAGQLTAEARRRKERADCLARLKRQLKEAVTAEQFERAATLRDEIRRLEDTAVS